MRRILLTILCVGLVVFSGTGSASAFSYEVNGAPTGDNFDGYYLFTVTDPNNDNIDNVNQWSEQDLSEFIAQINASIFDIEGIENYISELVLYGKYDPEEGFTGEEFNVEYDGGTFDTSYTGSWSTLDGTNIEFYTVKATSAFAVYWMGVGGANEAAWSTEHLGAGQQDNQPTISHLSLWNPSDPGPGPDPIPEPSTVFLLGLGLLGTLGLGRKLKK